MVKFVLTACSAAIAFAAPQIAIAAPDATICSDLLPTSPPPNSPKRAITPLDLVTLRQIGVPETLYGSASALSASPDGHRIAFAIYQAKPTTNDYCTGIAVLELAQGHVPHLIDAGGEMQFVSNEYRGRLWNIGMPALVRPVWSPDGKFVAYLRRDHGVTQVWVADLDGHARKVTEGAVDVEYFAWNRDGTHIVFSRRPGRVAERAAIEAEGLTGYRYDERSVPLMSSAPMPDAAIPLVASTVDLANGDVRAASAQDRALLGPDTLGQSFPPFEARDATGRVARAERVHADNPFDLARIEVQGVGGKTVPCKFDACQGKFAGLWWLPENGDLLFLHREGWATGNLALYAWRPGHGAPRLLRRTSGVIDDCALALKRLVCLYETATTPQRVVSIDTATGVQRDLFDPNPAFQTIRLGTVRRLEWTNDFGEKVRGDLVLPPGYKPGQRLPLIVTTYLSNGFLRGATGDEYPIHVFAEKGFAVLSYNLHEQTYSVGKDARNYDAVVGAGIRGWTDRRSIHSAVLAGVQRVVDLGIADPARIGISGLSDGSSTVGFAMINSRRFAAAVMSSCCLEPWTVSATGGPAFATLMQRLGWPAATADDRTFWASGSIIQNAAKIDTPLLIQAADHEYLLAVDVFAALREQGKPVDMYVFPGAWHFKTQPRQRLAVYARNLDWFSFWLQGKIDPDPAKAPQYQAWQALQANWRRAKP
jgi:dipeptidyl aminopeptidase/acylaminoacyl peptidase